MVKKLFISLCFIIFMTAGIAQAASKINVNTATVEQLETVKGIGPKTAEDIITYREKHGNFKNINDLVEVKGIGEKKVENLANELTVKGGSH